MKLAGGRFKGGDIEDRGGGTGKERSTPLVLEHVVHCVPREFSGASAIDSAGCHEKNRATWSEEGSPRRR